MKVFACPACGGALYFSNVACVCGASVGYDPEAEGFVLAPERGGHPDIAWCANRAAIWCNWVVDTPPGPSGGGYCRSCAMTEVIPDAFHGENRALWAEAEQAKRWVLANLGRWGWFKTADPGPRPIFHLLAEESRIGRVPVVMGHAGGLVTINVTEADPAEIAQRREALGEQLRTMTGHFRHELGHFFFERWRERPGFIDSFRAVFGDERADYGEALARHYDGRALPEGWADRHVTPYAAAHPHEDWAESFAHLLHLTDITDSFLAAGLCSDEIAETVTGGTTADAATVDTAYDAYADTEAQRLLTLAAHLGIALNHVNRAMGLTDIYPFVLTSTIREKLAFVHGWIREAG